MDFYKPSFDAFDEASGDSSLAKQLSLLNAATKQEFEQAERLIQSRLQTAIASLQQSSTAIRMMLSAQHPAERESASGIKLQRELEALLDNSTHLSRLANMMQSDFSASRRTCEQRTDSSISMVVNAVEQHRSTVQDNAIAMAEAALDRARSPSPLTHASRSSDRRPR